MFPDELVVVGVHSPKFPAEQITANVRQAVMRHGITHPVVNDFNMEIWSRYSVRAWPTVILLDPAGKVVAHRSGEIDADRIADMLQPLIGEAEAKGELARGPIAGISPPDETESLLRFPGKLIAAPGDRLFVADTGHHRILEVQLSPDGLGGEITRSFGSGEAGLRDGSAAEAQFHHPHGLALDAARGGSTLYVADTDNHAIRAIDLGWDRVRTVAGTGAMGRTLGAATTEPLALDLRSPWALVPFENALFIAMAGSHQIWVLLEEQQMGVFAGTGAEALIDGPRGEAAFNQPSDLVLDMGHLFVADAEASAIRAITLDEETRVFTVVGQGLFDFGDVDGVGAAVRLQHPTGLAGDGRLLYIADSYNHKIKTLDPTTGTVQTLIGTGAAGAQDGPFATATLHEPEGLTLLNGRLYIADTNNHRLRVADLARGVMGTVDL
jgi:DNA-binding beta-propeller fold protein YncE